MGFTGRKYYVNENYFDTWSASMAYILGFLTADGYISNSSISLNLNPKDIKVLEFIRSEIGSNQPISLYKSYHKDHKKYYDKARLQIFSVKLSKILHNKFGIVKAKSGKENIVFDIPNEFKYDYIRGVFDGDGYVGLNGGGILQSYICSASSVFIEQLLSILNLGYFYNQRRQEQQDIFLLRMGKQESIEFRDLIYQNNSFFLDRKKYIFYEYGTMKMNYYSDEEDEILYKYAPDWELIEKLIDRDQNSIYYRAKKLNLRQRKRFNIHIYTNYELEYIKTNFDPLNSTFSIKQMSKTLNIPLESIQNKVQNLGLKRSREYSQQELDFIKNSIGKLSLREISKQLKRTRKIISDKVKQIKLEMEI